MSSKSSEEDDKPEQEVKPVTNNEILIILSCVFVIALITVLNIQRSDKQKLAEKAQAQSPQPTQSVTTPMFKKIQADKKQARKPKSTPPPRKNPSKQGLSLAKKKAIFLDIVKAEDKATSEAGHLLGTEDWLKTEDALTEKYHQAVLKKHSISMKQLEQIKEQAFKEKWPIPEFSPPPMASMQEALKIFKNGIGQLLELFKSSNLLLKSKLDPQNERRLIVTLHPDINYDAETTEALLSLMWEFWTEQCSKKTRAPETCLIKAIFPDGTVIGESIGKGSNFRVY